MRVLRVILILASGVALVSLCYEALVNHPHMRPTEAIIVTTVLVMLGLNMIYLLADSRKAADSLRLFRLGRLWLDAKEKELRDRIGTKNSN